MRGRYLITFLDFVLFLVTVAMTQALISTDVDVPPTAAVFVQPILEGAQASSDSTLLLFGLEIGIAIQLNNQMIRKNLQADGVEIIKNGPGYIVTWNRNRPKKLFLFGKAFSDAADVCFQSNACTASVTITCSGGGITAQQIVLNKSNGFFAACEL